MTDSMTKKDADERKSSLAASIGQHVSRGWRVESQGDYTAVIAKGNRPNHILHFLLSLFTFGLWVMVWIAVVIFGGERRKTVTVDAYGQTLIQ